MEEWRMHFVLMKKWNYYEEKMILFWIFIFLIFIQICNGSQSLKFTIEPVDVSVSEGSSILLPCEGIASIGKSKEKLIPNIRWRGPDGQDIGIVGDTFRTQLANGSLYISAIEENRGLTGSYQCLLSVDGIGTIVSRFTRVSIAQPPETDNLFRVINLYVGQTAYFNCLTKPMPPFDIHYDIQWLKDDAPLRFDESRMIISPTGAIEIDAVKLSDSGTYHCNVTLGPGLHQSKLSSKSILTVNSTANEMVQALQAPIFLTETSAQIVREGDTITLDCVANGNPRPQLKWLRNGEEIDISDLDSRYHINGIGSLQITAIEENDAGNYICRAKNHVDSSDIQVSVQVQVPPKFIESPKDKKAHVKDEIEFVCEIHGKPTPVIQWLKNGDIITPNEYLYIVGGHNLRIAGLLSADAGMFQCIGSNPAGSVQASAWLQIEDSGSSAEVHAPLPGPPRDLIAQIVNPRFVALSWMEPIKNPDEILSYTVYYKMNTSDRERKITTKGDDQMANIQSLLPGKTYQFRVVGNSNYGPGESSNVYEVNTQPEENIAGAPYHFNGTVLSHNEIWLTWDLPIMNNMNITKYRVCYTENDGNEMHKDSNEMETVLGDLRPYTEYTISVAAFNQNGMGDPSNEILLKTFSAIPSEPPFNVTLETTSATSITVRWEPPPIEEQNGQITGYKIRYRRQKKPLQYETTPANVRHYELKGLDKMSAYQVKIAAMTINGTGPFTEWIHIETYENDLTENQVPGAPAWIKTRAGTGSITVTWASPSVQEIKVRGYVLGWGLGIPDVDTYELDENARSYTMKELIPNSEYVISIRARNLIGDGPPQYDTVRTRDDEPYELSGALEVPVGLRAMTMTSSSIVVYWTDTTLNRNQKVTDNRYYVVRYNTLESERNRKFYNVTDLNCMIDNLKPNTKYEFAVKVVKGRRESPYSMSVINSTFTTSLISAPRDLFAQPDEKNPQNIILEWVPPKHSNGLINGYIIFYTTDITKRDRDWQVDGVIGGDLHTIIIRNLLPHTMYYFKVQARAIKGSNGPFSTMVSQMTGYMAGGGGGGPGQPPHTKHTTGTTTSSSFMATISNNIIYIIIAITILTIIIATIVVTIMCRRKPPNTPEHSKLSYQKNNAGIKPPDLWIHHDQMELKNIEKNHNNTPGCSDGASSSGAMTLPRSVQGHDYDAEQPVVGTTQITNSLDKRSYVPGYMTTSMNSTMERGQYPRTQYNANTSSNRQVIGGGHADPTNISQQNLHQIQQQQQQQQQLQQNANAITAQTPENAYGYDSMPSNYSNPSVTYAPGLSIDAPKRGQGHPLKSFSVPGPPAIVAPLHIAPAKHPVPTVTIRPQNSSPYKKPTLINTLPNRLQAGPSVTHSNDEIQRLAPSNSTEELNQEMANLEGLMKDLSAITANEFEC